eukprot:3499509-Rhodomonas_salina.1
MPKLNPTLASQNQCWTLLLCLSLIPPLHPLSPTPSRYSHPSTSTLFPLHRITSSCLNSSGMDPQSTIGARRHGRGRKPVLEVGRGREGDDDRGEK